MSQKKLKITGLTQKYTDKQLFTYFNFQAWMHSLKFIDHPVCLHHRQLKNKFKQ